MSPALFPKQSMPHATETPEIQRPEPVSSVGHGKVSMSHEIHRISSEGTASPADVPQSPEAGTETEELSWDSQDDPRNPRNWSRSRKWFITILTSTFAFCTMMTSTLVAPALPEIQKELKIQNNVEAQLVITSYVLSYGFGPFIWAPLSERYGRLRTLQVANTCFFVFNMLCGFARDKATMIAGRVLSGVGAAGALAIDPGILSDCWSVEQRGRSLAILSVIPLLAPAIGPIIGGQVAEYSTWRWAFWSTSAFDVAIQFLAVLFLRETHAPTILRRIQRQKQRQAQDHLADEKHPESHPGPAPASRPLYLTLLTTFRRPVHLLLSQPAIQIPSLFSALTFGVLFTVMSGYAATFVTVYHQTPSQASLHYLALGIGYTLGSQLTGRLSDALYARLTRPLSTPPDPRVPRMISRLYHPHPTSELRLLPFLPATLLTSAGLLLYTFTARPTLPWILPDLGMALYAMGNTALNQCTSAYVIDAFAPRGWAASATAGVWALKSVGGFGVPLLAVLGMDVVAPDGVAGFVAPGDVASASGKLGTRGVYAVLAGVVAVWGVVDWVVLIGGGARLRAWGARRLESSS